MPNVADPITSVTYYEVLGVERRATSEDVRSAYRVRSHMFHPDKYATYPEPLRGQLMTEASKEFKKLTAAYDVLRDPARRAVYDRQLDSQGPGRGRGGATRRASTVTERAPRATPRAAPAPRKPATPPEPPRPRERDPLLVVRPERLDFGSLAAGTSRSLPLKISNAGGRTLFGEIASNRAWLTVNRRSFVSSSALVFVTVDTAGLRPGEEYAGALVVSTLNGGDQVVPVMARISGRPEPLLAGAPSLIDFGPTQSGGTKARTVKLANAGTGTLIGSVAVKGGWLAVTESSFRGNDVSFELIANTASLASGEHTGELLIFSNGGQASVQVLIEMPAPVMGGAIIITRSPDQDGDSVSDGAGGGDQPDAAAGERGEAAAIGGAMPVNGPVSTAAQRALLKRITSVEPGTVWERDFLRRVAQLVRAGERLAPGELAKIFELESQAQAIQAMNTAKEALRRRDRPETE